jgi:hypothetical protein
MSCHKLSRQYVHLVMNEGRGLFSLRHMDVSKLFYPSTANALEADAEAKMKKKNEADAEAKMKKKNGIINIVGMSLGRHLPRPSIHYQPCVPVPASNPYCSIGMLALFGDRNNKILCSDTAGNASIYNTDSHSLIPIPELNAPKPAMESVAVSIPAAAGASGRRSDFESDDHTDRGSLYIMDMNRAGGPGCFEVLSYDPAESWCWDTLPPPPFSNFRGKPRSAVVVVDGGGSRICVSSTTETYCFDTAAREWSKVGGDWVLPFDAVYAPELGLWLGLSEDGDEHREDSYELCALALGNLSTTTAAAAAAPAVQRLGRDFEPPEDWWLVTCGLLSLGSGRFCIASSFEIEDDLDECNSTPVTVFTGVEVLLPTPSEQGLRMVKHKSKCFLDSFRYVL